MSKNRVKSSDDIIPILDDNIFTLPNAVSTSADHKTTIQPLVCLGTANCQDPKLHKCAGFMKNFVHSLFWHWSPP